MSLLVRIVFLFAACLALPAAAQTVGVASATSGEPRGTPPAQNERILRVGVDVFANERVRTGPTDRAHLVFRDGSALSVGANSELTIDRFVYDSNTQQGDLAFTAARGAFRFVGGAISKKNEVKITTPSAQIGVRGGIITVAVGNDGSATVTFLFGDSATVSNPAGTQKAIRYGSQIFVPYGGAPFAPIVLPPGSLQAYLSLFEQSQNSGNIVGPGDRAQLDALVAALNNVVLPRTGTGEGLQTWLAYLQLLSTQAIATTNANRISGGTPPAPAAPQQSSDPVGGEGGCGTNCY
jgi:FecR protein